jgi:hypothetical protein
MANINAQLAGANFQVIDNAAAVQRVNSPIATLVAQCANSFYDAYYLIPNAAPLSVVLPATPCWVFLIRNISGSNTISITLTPQGGAAWLSPYVLVPSGIFMTIAAFSSNPSSGGFTALTLQSSNAGTYAEIGLAA